MLLGRLFVTRNLARASTRYGNKKRAPTIVDAPPYKAL